ncbi:porin [Ancylomarina sp. 16SWW S1-10-2]|uniref:porin n=1 Tax=Ancylomarina sp. 16SWW S1-10-2 TaxID=2499681 RepID=UPI00189E2406|nr:porin [Ancylomarina sp. 16SWW S1-10-2]
MNFKKTLIALFAIIAIGGTAMAQNALNLKALEDKIASLDQKNDAFNFYINLQNSANTYFNSDDYEGIDFKTNQLRLEMRGEIVKGVRYRVRQRMNRGTTAENLDNLSTATDIASISIDLAKNFTVTGGKQCTAFGGYEFDLNPIDVYQFSDMVDNITCFLTGVDFAYQMDDQQFRFQIVNSRNSSLSDEYKTANNVESSKNALGYTLNWNGNLFDGIVQTRWSYSLFQETKEMSTNLIALGTQVKLGKKAQIQFDWMNSNEDIDTKGIVSGMINNGMSATDVVYNSLIAKIDYRLNKKFNMFVKGMYETATNDGNKDENLDDEFRKSYAYMAGVEFHPIADDLKVFFTYTGRFFDYESSITENLGIQDQHTNRLSLGLIYRLKMY